MCEDRTSFGRRWLFTGKQAKGCGALFSLSGDGVVGLAVSGVGPGTERRNITNLTKKKF